MPQPVLGGLPGIQGAPAHFGYPPQDRLVAKEVAIGTLRELLPPTGHIGLSTIAPWMEVASDDVIFDYMKSLTDGLAPARAEDAESELAQKDTLYGGVGRASIIDWALKDRYSASDVTRYREGLLLQQRLGVLSTDLPMAIRDTINEFDSKVARDDALRRRKLDNRLEWLIMTALETNAITYNDGKIKFTVTYGRPAGQTNQAPANGTWIAANKATMNPIGDLLAVQDFMYDTYGVRMNRAIGSRKALNAMMLSDRFIATSGMVGATGAAPIDLNYLSSGWGPEAAKRIVSDAAGIDFIEYDSVYRTRAVGATTIVNTRFLSDKKIYLLPDPQDVADLDDAIGFGRTLTSPHPEGMWTPGFYEWEEETRDPWTTVRGTGVKAFPVLPHMDWTYTMTVLP